MGIFFSLLFLVVRPVFVYTNCVCNHSQYPSFVRYITEDAYEKDGQVAIQLSTQLPKTEQNYKQQIYWIQNGQKNVNEDTGNDYDSKIPKTKNNLNVSIEIFAGKNLFTSDLKVFKQLFSKFSVFIRHRTSIEDKDNVDSFFLSDFCYKLNDKLHAVFESQVGSNIGTIPRFGLQYMNNFDNFFCYLLYSYGTKDNTFEFEHIFSLDFDISKKCILKPKVELIINLIDGKYNFTIGRPRLGVKVDKIYMGVGADVFNAGGKTNTTIGLFLDVEF